MKDADAQLDRVPERDVWAFEGLKELLMREKGFDLEAYKEKCILRRLYLKVRSLGMAGLGPYYREVRRDPEALERLFQYLTINVTEFFRNPSAFAFLEKRVLPRLFADRRPSSRLRIWSVGCSSGEEPFSLAILALRVRRLHRLATPFRVLATDVDRAVLARARSGRYPADRLRNLAPEDLREHFRPAGQEFEVSQELRGHVEFEEGNVLTQSPSTPQDLVVCRNLLIYLSRENQEMVINRFSRAMRPGGYLMLGKAETLIGNNRLHFLSVSPAERVYRKREAPLQDGEP